MSSGAAGALPVETKYTYPPITIILIVILLIFFFFGFFSMFFCRCFAQNVLYTWHLRNTPGTPVGGPTTAVTANNGLESLIIQTFPTFTYSSVKDYRREKYGLECAICLVEFKDEDLLRLLTACCHVFHQECVDLWFEAHKTCPVCRRDLDMPLDSPVKSLAPSVHNGTAQNESLADGFIALEIKDDNEDATKEETVEDENKEGTFSRSHSTGHSIVKNKGKEDRYSLILPEIVKTEIMRRHKPSRSCETFGDFATKLNSRNRILGEASGGGDAEDNAKA